MSHKTPKSLSEQVLRPGGALDALARQARENSDLTETMRRCLPAELAGGVRAATIRPDGTLVVLATSPAWAARLRFESGTLLEKCAQQEPTPTRLKVRVSGAED